MDQIRKRDVENACNDFIASIDRAAVCDLASSFHDKKPCRMFKEPQRGSYNVCFPVIFASNQESNEGEKWMVRFPLLPRLPFWEEKLRGEIATMK
jgi:hypothetical protein